MCNLRSSEEYNLSYLQISSRPYLARAIVKSGSVVLKQSLNTYKTRIEENFTAIFGSTH